MAARCSATRRARCGPAGSRRTSRTASRSPAARCWPVRSTARRCCSRPASAPSSSRSCANATAWSKTATCCSSRCARPASSTRTSTSSCCRTCISTTPADCWRRGAKGARRELLFPNATYVVSDACWQRAREPHPRDRASFIPELAGAAGSQRTPGNRRRHAFAGARPAVRFHFSDGHTPGLMLAEIVGPEHVDGEDHGGVVFCADLIPGRPWVHVPITMGYDRNRGAADRREARVPRRQARAQRASVLHPRSRLRAGAGDARRQGPLRHRARSRGTARASAGCMRLAARRAAALLLCLLLPAGVLAQDAPGVPQPDRSVRDREFGVVARHYGLERRVEMLQWQRAPGGYAKAWSESAIDSTGFADGYRNPGAFPLQSRRWTALENHHRRQAARSGGGAAVRRVAPVPTELFGAAGEPRRYVPARRRRPGQCRQSARPARRRPAHPLARTRAAAAGRSHRAARWALAAGRGTGNRRRSADRRGRARGWRAGITHASCVVVRRRVHRIGCSAGRSPPP